MTDTIISPWRRAAPDGSRERSPIRTTEQLERAGYELSVPVRFEP